MGDPARGAQGSAASFPLQWDLVHCPLGLGLGRQTGSPRECFEVFRYL